MGKKKSEAAGAAAPGASFQLGPQDDGSIVVRIPSDFDLMVLRKAVEKQEKNSQAAGGTISALAEGEDPFLDRVQRSLTKLKSIIASARAPENQVADTPIGKEIARNQAEAAAPKGEQIDGQPDGVTWAPHVPKPRPKLGELIRWPKGEAVSVANVIGFDDKLESFIVKGADDMQYAVQAHEAGTATEWRIAGSEYDTPRIDPKAMSVGDELVQAVEGDDRLLSDAPQGGDADDDGGASAGSSEPAAPAKPAAKTAARKSSPQRERNARNAGLKPLPNAVPKPSAAKKGGSKGRKR